MSRVSSSFLHSSSSSPGSSFSSPELTALETRMSTEFGSFERFSFTSLSTVDPNQHVDPRSFDLLIFLLRHRPKGRSKISFNFEYRIYSRELSLLLASPLNAQSSMNFNVTRLFSVLSLACSESSDPLASPASAPIPFVFLLQFAGEPEFFRFRESWVKCAWESARNESFDLVAKNPADHQALLASVSNPALTNFLDKESKDEEDRMKIDDMEFIDQPGAVKFTPQSSKLPQPFSSPEPGRRSVPRRQPVFDDSSDSEDSESQESFDEKSDEKPRAKLVRSKAGGSARRPAAAPIEANDNLAVGITKLNRTYVGRGAQLGVFRHDDDGQLEYLTHIPCVKSLDGSSISSSQMMLHESDQKLLLLNPSDSSKVHVFDLETQKVVAELTGKSKTATDFEIRSIAPVKKYAEATSEQLFYGINGNSVFSMDPRLRGNSSIAQMNEYKTKLNNYCIVSTGSGNVAVTSSKGEIRLYNDISKRAKSLIPGLGDPITAIDVTEDGVWIVATTKTYLLVIKTEFADAKGKSNKNGWLPQRGFKTQGLDGRINRHCHFGIPSWLSSLVGGRDSGNCCR